MYKIYINENTLILADSKEIQGTSSGDKTLVAPYSGKTKMLLSYIDMLEKTNRFDKITIHSAKLKSLLKDFESLFTIVKAAGGLVVNPKNEILFIFRRGHWDLPKGKIDKGEKKKAAAVREVIEETGLKKVSIEYKLHTTRHTYKLKTGKRAIKKTFWYNMTANHQELIPQVEEDIVKAEWISFDNKTIFKEPIFKSIQELLSLHLESKMSPKA